MTRSPHRSDVVDRSRMFAAIPYDLLREIRSATAIALYAILKMYAGANRQAHPSRMTLAEALGYKTRRPVDNALAELVALGLVDIIPRFRDEDGEIGYEKTDRFKEQTSNGYVLYDVIRRTAPADNSSDPPVSHRTQPPQEKDTGLYPPGHGGCIPQAITPMAWGIHEGYSFEGDSGKEGMAGVGAETPDPAGAGHGPDASPEIPPSWIADPRRARCAAHAGVADPPPCRKCATARHAAETARAERKAHRLIEDAARRAARDACPLCDENGIVDDGHGLTRCTHPEADRR